MRNNLIEKRRKLKGKLSLMVISTFLLAFTTLLLLTTPAYSFSSMANPDLLTLDCNDFEKEECTIVFHSDISLDEPVEIEDVIVIELEDEVVIGFDTQEYLPDGFNPLKGFAALDWTKIELIELEEELNLNVDREYLPNDPRLLNCLNPQDWNAIVLNDLKKNTTIYFKITQHLPKAIQSIKGLNSKDWKTIISKELEKNINTELDLRI